MKHTMNSHNREKRKGKYILIYLILHFLNFLTVKHIEIFIAANVVALHLTVILIFVMCLTKEIEMHVFIRNKNNDVIGL